MALPPAPGRAQTAQRLAAPASWLEGRRSGAYGMPMVTPCGILPLSRIDSSTVTTSPLPSARRSFADAMLSTGCSWVLPSVFRTTYRVVDLLAMITFSPGVSQPCGAVGRNIPQAPNTAMTTTPTMVPGRTARNGLGAASSEPSEEGWTNAASMRRFAKV